MPRYTISMLTDLRLKNGCKLEDVKVTGKVTTTIDPRYGEDADGNRGGCMEWIDDIIFIDAERIQPIRTLHQPRLPAEPIDLFEIDTASHRQICKDLESYFNDMDRRRPGTRRWRRIEDKSQ